MSFISRHIVAQYETNGVTVAGPRDERVGARDRHRRHDDRDYRER